MARKTAAPADPGSWAVGDGAYAVQFVTADLELFSRASGDRNPLHMSADYARKTAYGERVVFGALGTLACLGRLQRRPSMVASRVTVEFAHPVFLDIGYVVEVLEDSPERARVVLRDGRRILMRLDLFRAAGRLPTDDAPVPARRTGAGEPTGYHHDPGRPEALERRPDELVTGFALSGRWSPDAEELRTLLERYRLTCNDHGDDMATTAVSLLWASYLVGMELPGRRALFSRLSLDFEPDRRIAPEMNGAGQVCGLPRCFEYSATIRGFHQGFNLMTAAVALRSAGVAAEDVEGVVAAGEVHSFVRFDPPAPSDGEWQHCCPPGNAMRGKVVLVVGASRGLGAAIAEAACRQGGTVVANYARSRAEAEALSRRLAGAPGRLVLEQGDARDPAWCEDLRTRVLLAYGRIDALVCSACPALLPAWVEPGTVSRIRNHVTDSLSLVLVPLAEFLPALVTAGGRVVLVSSAAVSQPVADWPHYVAAKGALEGLIEAAALEQPAVRFLIVRPPRLATDLTNTPLGRQNALSPVRVASRLVRWLWDAGDRIEEREIARATTVSPVDYLQEF